MRLYKFLNDDKSIDIKYLSETDALLKTKIHSEIRHKTLINCDDIDIIENDAEKDYGISNIHPSDDTLVVDLYKTRLDIHTGKNYKEWYEHLSENGTAYWKHRTNMIDAVNCHLEFWGQPDGVIPDRVYIMTIEDISLLLKNGFDGDRLLISLVD